MIRTKERTQIMLRTKERQAPPQREPHHVPSLQSERIPVTVLGNKKGNRNHSEDDSTESTFNSYRCNATSTYAN